MNKSTKVALWLLAFVAVALFVYQLEIGRHLSAGLKRSATDNSVTIATGPPDGMYHQFGLMLQNARPDRIKLVQTQGSGENIDKLRKAEIDFILVQNDMAQDAFFGRREKRRFAEIRYVWPVFSEYVQFVVPDRSAIKVLADLRGKQLCVGEANSGSYINAVDVLREAGLREAVDFVPIMKGSAECIADMKKGEAYAALVTTSRRIIAEEQAGFRQIRLSDEMAKELIAKTPYFRDPGRDQTAPGRDDAANANPSFAGPKQQLEIETFLATHEAMDDDRVEFVINVLRRQSALSDYGPLKSNRQFYDPVSQRGGVGIQFHDESKSYNKFEKLKYKEDDSFIYISTLFFIWLSCFIASLFRNNYNRIGNNPAMIRFLGFITWIFSGLFKPVSIVVALLIVMGFGMFALTWQEDRFALVNGGVSPFAYLSTTDRMIWLLAYVSSGFNAAIYPASQLGKAIVAGLAVLMATAPFTIIITLLDSWNRRRTELKRGLGQIYSRDHILLCGWNEKAPGMIFSLTGSDIDERQHVTIVADLKEQFPLSELNFNERYVEYVKGDAANINVLYRANVEKAKAALVLADFGGDSSADSATWNRNGILATFNVEAVNPNAHICAEMEYVRGINYYKGSGANALLHPNTVVTRMTTMAIMNPLLLDFVMDMITYHDFDEIYSYVIDAKFMKKMDGCNKMTLATVARHHEKYPVNILGFISKSLAKDGLAPEKSGTGHSAGPDVESPDFRDPIFDPSFALSENIKVWVHDAEIKENDILIFTGKRDHSLRTASPVRSALSGLWAHIFRADFEGILEILGRGLKSHLWLWIYWWWGKSKAKAQQLYKRSLPASAAELAFVAQASSDQRRHATTHPEVHKILICFDGRRPAEAELKDEHHGAYSRFVEQLPKQLALLPWEKYDLHFCFEEELGETIRIDRGGEFELSEFKKIIIMTLPQIRSRASSIEQVNEVDTGLVLLTKRTYDLLCNVLGTGHEAEAKKRIATELLNFDNRQLLEKANAGDVLPSALLVGRFMANQAVCQDHVSDFLLAAMNLAEDTHLYVHTVTEADPVFSGRTYGEILTRPDLPVAKIHEKIDAFRLLGWLPADDRERRRLKNSTGRNAGQARSNGGLLDLIRSIYSGGAVSFPEIEAASDFQHHFVTVIDYRFPDRPIAVGDQLVLMIRRAT